MKKKILGAVLMSVILMSQLCAFASYTTYSIRDGKAVLSDTDNANAFVTVADEFKGIEVTGIGAEAFMGDCNIEKIVLPETVTFIEWGAFEGCTNLKEINIPENVVMIEDMTFADCRSLETVNFPENLQSIGIKAFSNTALTEIIIPESVKVIDIKAFENCKNLETIILPDGIEYIGDGAFEGCDNLTVKCIKGTYTEEYLKANGITYIAK